MLAFLDYLWGLGTEKEPSCRTGPPGYICLESIPVLLKSFKIPSLDIEHPSFHCPQIPLIVPFLSLYLLALKPYYLLLMKPDLFAWWHLRRRWMERRAPHPPNRVRSSTRGGASSTTINLSSRLRAVPVSGKQESSDGKNVNLPYKCRAYFLITRVTNIVLCR